MTYPDAFSNLMLLECSSLQGSPPYGITQSIFDSWAISKGIGHQDVNSLSRILASDFAQDEYWNPCGGGSLPDKLDFVVFQFGYNAGLYEAITSLQKAIGVTEDGVIGPITLKTANQFPLVDTCKAVFTYQNAFYKKIENPSDVKYEGGWHNRVSRTARIVGITL